MLRCGRVVLRARIFAFLALLLGAAVFSGPARLDAAPVRRISLAPDIPLSRPRAAGSASDAFGTMVGGAAGQIIKEINRAQKRPALPDSDYGAVDTLRSAVTAGLRQKNLLAPREKAEAELRLRITNYGVIPPGGFSKHVIPALAVQAQLVAGDQIVWEERRGFPALMKKTPKILKKDFYANPELAKPAMEQIARALAAEFVQALVTPGTGHQYDAIRR
jgi:hypothetical protein